jgi:hypothetical protein
MEPPPLLSQRPRAVQYVLANVVPTLFGVICGVVLSFSGAAYLGLQLLAAIGGVGAGYEHRGAGEGAARGALGGAQFGAGILAAYEIGNIDPKTDLPHPAIVLAVFTTVVGALLGALGGMLRARRMRGPAPAGSPE